MDAHRWLTFCRILSVFVFAGLVTGCVENDYPSSLRYPLRDDPILVKPLETTPTGFDKPGELFDLLKKVRDEKDKNNILPIRLVSVQKRSVEALLRQLFGRPRFPQVNGVDPAIIEELKLDEDTLAEGSRLYRLHCLHCHGLTGNGRGPTAPWVNPHPRDYRPGIFKFTSSGQIEQQRKPLRSDLVRTLRQGIEGTSMPSFGLLPDDEIEALVSYVIHLSIRGQTEMLVLSDLMEKNKAREQKELSPEEQRKEVEAELANLQEFALQVVENVAREWQQAQSSLIVPLTEAPENLRTAGASPTSEVAKESIRNGFELFMSAKAGCGGCHQDFGRKERFLNDAWGTIVRPADLVKGVYRGGRRPIDLYWRIHSGVNGAGMPAIFNGLRPSDSELKALAAIDKLDGQTKREAENLLAEIKRLQLPKEELDVLLTDYDKFTRKDELKNQLASQRTWDIVNFLLVLPYPKMRQAHGIDIH
ncbi:MAG: hypothetical protein KatS3mg105_2576 [Gemmatales bacterium]|nr:MAG: hypothetical protein KatS3mg105_2576 [Gemmatales bacterium]